jgi:energy-coupling factor transporter ATP-binding protein EcfA2
LQTLINDPSWHHIERRQDAERTFDSSVVSAFYYGLDGAVENPEEWRESRIPLPTRKEGYSRVMLVGTTGAGKTTLLRHIIGTDHVRDRFPATSIARTTTADMEIVIAPGAYEAVVTFTPEHIIRGVIDECIESACLAALDDQPDSKIAEALLSHPEQRFRLSYTLGEWKPNNAEDEWSYSFKGTNGKEERLDEGESVTDRDVLANQLRLETYVARIKRLARFAGTVLENKFEVRPRPAQTSTASERADDAAWLELHSEVVLDLDEFSQIALDIKDDVESRFDALPLGKIEKAPSGWPKCWHFSSEDRDSLVVRCDLIVDKEPG